MSNEITAWVVSVTFHEQALTEINEVSNHFTRAGFVLTLNDEEGSPHELGTNTFGLLSGLFSFKLNLLSSFFGRSSCYTPAPAPSPCQPAPTTCQPAPKPCGC